MNDIMISIAIILAVSFIFSELFFRLKYPRVIGQIVAGIILGMPILSNLFIGAIEEDIAFLAQLGIIFLLLLTGLEINLDKFKKAKKDSILIGLFCVLVPFSLGFILMKSTGYSNLISFIVGACLSLTAEGTTLKILMDMRALNTKLGTIMVGAGIFDDIIGILFLSVVSFQVSGNFLELMLFPVKIALFIAIVYLTYKLFPMGLRQIEKEHSGVSTFSFILLFGIVVAVISQFLAIGHIVGAFMAGIIIHLSEHKKGAHHETVKELKIMTFSLVIPFFFIYIGIQFQKALPLVIENIWLAIMILLVATIGKILGALIATPFTDLTLAQTHLIGWGMNSRGLIELVVAGIAFENGFIPAHIFGSIIAAAIITTLAFPIVMKYIIKRNKDILESLPSN